MISSSREALHRIFQEDTGLLIRAIERLLDIEFPEPTEITVVNSDLTELAPVEPRVDTLLRVDTKRSDFLLAIEAQSYRDPDKPGAWAYYLAYLYARFHCEPVLLVLCQDTATARWAARPVSLGLPGRPSILVQPLVLGPDDVPVIEDAAEAARDMPLAVFSAITHGKGAAAPAVLEALAHALGTVDPGTAAIFAEYVELGLGDTPSRQMWKDLMSTLSYFFQSEAAQKVRAEGREEGRLLAKADGILSILEHRGISVPVTVRERVLACTDLAQFDAWWDRAFTVSNATALFRPNAGNDEPADMD